MHVCTCTLLYKSYAYTGNAGFVCATVLKAGRALRVGLIALLWNDNVLMRRHQTLVYSRPKRTINGIFFKNRIEYNFTFKELKEDHAHMYNVNVFHVNIDHLF